MVSVPIIDQVSRFPYHLFWNHSEVGTNRVHQISVNMRNRIDEKKRENVFSVSGDAAGNVPMYAFGNGIILWC